MKHNARDSLSADRQAPTVGMTTNTPNHPFTDRNIALIEKLKIQRISTLLLCYKSYIMKRLLQLAVLSSTFFSFAQNYNYLGSYTSNGTPNYLVQPGDVVTQATMDMVSNSLPESYPVPDYNPHYISSGYDTDVILNEDADVWVTFVKEGAGYKNVLGFYTYDVNNPPSSAPQPEDITIIFPNASAAGSGGGLNAGDKVHLGQFPANTGIGWVLLANAWNGSSQSVGYGQWQLYSNPDYNPESDPNLRYHNVLLNDPTNERVILGFEDIRRDYGSCDNDFNDAIFYVTANPYVAMQTTNFADVSSASDVTSANTGGLESNGSLAQAIAKRNLKRQKEGTSKDHKNRQEVFRKSKGLSYSVSSGKSMVLTLDSVLPDTGMYGTETAHVSSPTDLLGITNATEVFSVDYYEGPTRVSAVLATATQGSVYDHSKVICDRLNSSVLEDVRTVTVRGHQVINSKIIRATGETEYTLSFSVKLDTAANELFSFWNIDQYPTGDYFNFQIWGSSFSQVFSIGNHILDTLTAEKPLNSQTLSNVVPPVFVSSGYYENGNLHLDIVNKIGATSINFDGNLAPTEVSTTQTISQTLSLSGNWNDSLTVNTGQLFDIGFSLSLDSTTQQDALYLADGPWGLDYLDTEASIDNFNIANPVLTPNDNLYQVEREPVANGQVKGTVNLFRHVLAGDQTLDVQNYESFQFSIANSHPVEVILVQEGLTDWNNRLRYTIPVNTSTTAYSIAFSDFTDGSGNPANLSDVKTIVFSLQGNFTTFEAFTLDVQQVAFSETTTLSTDTFDAQTTAEALVYPNPMTNSTTLSFTSLHAETVSVVIYDQLGRAVMQQDYKSIPGQNKIQIFREDLNHGIYLVRLEGTQQSYPALKLVVK